MSKLSKILPLGLAALLGLFLALPVEPSEAAQRYAPVLKPNERP